MKNIVVWLRRHYLIAIAICMLIFTLVSVFSHPKPKLAEPEILSSISPFKNAISGTGIIEPKSKNIEIGTSLSGVVSKVYVVVGQKVKKDDLLFTIDDRDAKARLIAAKAKLEAVNAALDESQHQLGLYQQVKDTRAISKDEFMRRTDAVKENVAKVKEAQADVDVIATEVERLSVKAPIDGTILQVNIEPGEFAQAGNVSKPLMVMGDTDVYYVRVEVDETNALGISPKSKAVAYLRGYNDHSIDLNFVRYEPLLISKKSISSKGNEQVDTRVIELLYSFDNKKVGAFVGQQMDVYIENGNKTN